MKYDVLSRVGAILGLIFLISSVPAVFAQQVPAGSEPGAASERFKQDIEQRRKQFSTKPLKAPEMELNTREEKPTPQESISFVLKDIKIEGTTLFKPEAFRDCISKYLNKEVTFKDLDALVDCIKSKYKAKGYLTTTAYVPEQEIKEGILTIKVIEGKMGELKIEGTKWFPAKLIQDNIHVKKNELLNITTLERDILRVNKNPDVEAKTVISAGSQPETSDVTMKVKDHFPYYIGAGADNTGTRLVGRENAVLSFRSSDMTGHNDSFFTSYLFSKHANAQSIGYAIPIDNYGTKMGWNFSHYNMRDGKEFKDLRITGDTKTLGVYLTKELYLSSEKEGYLTAGLDAKSTKKHFDGVITADDEMRIPYIGCDFTNNDLWGSSTISPRFDFGTSGFLGASHLNHPTASRPETGGSYFRYSQNVTRVQRMFLESYSVIHFQAQVATHTLAPTEQIQLGGQNSIRGYPEGDFLADSGALLNFDWIFPLYLMPESVKLPFADVPLRQQIQPIAFIDIGGGRLNKAQPYERRDKFLASFGGGIRIRLYKNVYCRFEWADPVGANPTQGSGPSNFHFSVQTEI